MAAGNAARGAAGQLGIAACLGRKKIEDTAKFELSGTNGFDQRQASLSKV
jgi:hypothetical protein